MPLKVPLHPLSRWAIGIAAIFLLALTGFRGADLSYTLLRLQVCGRSAEGTVLSCKVGCGRSTRYAVDYTVLGRPGHCQVSADVYRSLTSGTRVKILYDPDNIDRSWMAASVPTLFWGAMLFDGIFCLLMTCTICFTGGSANG